MLIYGQGDQGEIGGAVELQIYIYSRIPMMYSAGQIRLGL